MGLDMYLTARKSVFGNFPETKDQYNNVVQASDFGDLADTEMSHASVRVTSIYWRKANQIHGWFVQNIQNGQDECDEFDVPITKLKELRDLCVRVKTEKNAELLPPLPGFFFGSYEIDEWYWKDIDYTIEQLNRVLDAIPGDEVNSTFLHFTYQSSW